MEILNEVESLHSRWLILSSSVVEHGWLWATITKMALWNRIGFTFNERVSTNMLYADNFWDIVLEVQDDPSIDTSKILWETKQDQNITIGGANIYLKDVQWALLRTLETVYSTASAWWIVDAIQSQVHAVVSPNILKTAPRVLLPVFPGTNSHRDSAQALRRAGFTNIEVFYFRDTTHEALIESVKYFAEALKWTNVTVFSGWFGSGDEPDGSAKYMATLMRMNEVKNILQEYLDKSIDTLTLGICNGFQLLMKLWVFTGDTSRINDFLDTGDMTLAHNTNLRHITDITPIRSVSNKWPWLSRVQVWETYVIPTSHGEWRLIASTEQIMELIKNWQAVFQYLDADGNPTNQYNGSAHGIAGLVSRDGLCHILKERMNFYGKIYQGIIFSLYLNEQLRHLV
jgi:phosphoribosylformylglycinamidine synthase